MPKQLEWTVEKRHADGTPCARRCGLATGCTLSLIDVENLGEQRAVLRLKLAGASYSKTFARPMLEGRTEEGSREWAMQRAWDNLSMLEALVDASKSALKIQNTKTESEYTT